MIFKCVELSSEGDTGNNKEEQRRITNNEIVDIRQNKTTNCYEEEQQYN